MDIVSAKASIDTLSKEIAELEQTHKKKTEEAQAVASRGATVNCGLDYAVVTRQTAIDRKKRELQGLQEALVEMETSQVKTTELRG